MFMDKTLTKLVAKALNVPTVEYIRVNEADYAKRGKFLLKNIESRLKYPVVVKPAHLGSSIGISVAETEESAAAAVEAAFQLDDRVIIEKFLKNKRVDKLRGVFPGRGDLRFGARGSGFGG